ncbi:HAD family hydrolase [Rhodoferax sp.]|uniref:HAD family hydrolase n=1 Tax=Rhodoferax sp. TaxID=50421 RepID=UPI003BB68E43
MSFEAILFDCDGVLVDSEPITNGVLRDMLEESGWALTPDECMRVFVGKAVRDERALIEARTGRPLTEDWMAEFYARRNSELQARLLAIAGAHEAVAAAHAHVAERIACASGADRFKVEMQLAQVGLMDYFAGRIFSGHEMPRSKPAPDVYLAAAAHLGAAGARCLVIEDTPTGVTAGVAAGATVWAYCPLPEHAVALRQAGASHLFGHMAELPGLLAAA